MIEGDGLVDHALPRILPSPALLAPASLAWLVPLRSAGSHRWILLGRVAVMTLAAWATSTVLVRRRPRFFTGKLRHAMNQLTWWVVLVVVLSAAFTVLVAAARLRDEIGRVERTSAGQRSQRRAGVLPCPVCGSSGWRPRVNCLRCR
ncbi:MAG TPA: hypothetical protein VIU15_41970 [Streptomyces sp.]